VLGIHEPRVLLHVGTRDNFPCSMSITSKASEDAENHFDGHFCSGIFWDIFKANFQALLYCNYSGQALQLWALGYYEALKEMGCRTIASGGFITSGYTSP
jgi:hypothetical protein